MIYVQLDKCLKQFREGRNAEDEEGRPDRLQAWLSAIADVNDKKVEEESEKDEELAVIRREAHDMIQEKEVKRMVIQERYERMDWVTYGNEQMRKGEKKGGTDMLVRLVEKGRLSVEDAAAECDMSVKAFKEKYMSSSQK